MSHNDVMENKNASPSACSSVPLEESDIGNISLLYGILRELWSTSEFLLASDAISILTEIIA